MEEGLERLSIYDILVRVMSGGLTILGAYWGKVIDIPKSEKDFWAVAFFIGAYGIGLILEELSYWLEKLFNTRKKIENNVCEEKKYKNYDLQKCKDTLIKHDKEIIAEEPLAHIVLADTLKIAYIGMLIIKLLNIIFDTQNRDALAVCTVLAFGVIIIILDGRQKHYCKRRVERIFDYCIAKGYNNIDRT